MSECSSEIRPQRSGRNPRHLRDPRHLVAGDTVVYPARKGRLGDTEASRNLGLLQPAFADEGLDRHGPDFSRTKLACQERISSGAIQLGGETVPRYGMATRILSKPELDAFNEEVKAFQRELLEHVPAWLKFRGLKQKDLAEYLGTTEGSVSKWISGGDAMKFGLIAKIATFLQAEPGDLMHPPPGRGLTKPVANLLDAAEGLDAEELDRLAELARLLRRKRTD